MNTIITIMIIIIQIILIINYIGLKNRVKVIKKTIEKIILKQIKKEISEEADKIIELLITKKEKNDTDPNGKSEHENKTRTKRVHSKKS